MPKITAHEAYVRRDEWTRGKGAARVDDCTRQLTSISKRAEGYTLFGRGVVRHVDPDEMVEIAEKSEKTNTERWFDRKLDEAFDARLDELLTMPEGWRIIGVRSHPSGDWSCVIARGHELPLAFYEYDTARAAIEAAKKAAMEKGG